MAGADAFFSHFLDLWAKDRAAIPPDIRAAYLDACRAAALGFDAAAIWRGWAPDLRHVLVDHGHFMAEEAPGHTAGEIQRLIRRP